MSKKVKFDDLSPEEQGVYLRAAQMLLDEDDAVDDGPCELCSLPSPEHRNWCPMGMNDETEPA